MSNPTTTSVPGQPAFPRHPRLRSFKRKFGQPALSLACHAAFPIALTPDLLYSLWEDFPSDARGQPIGAPWVAVADLLLSGLCDEVGHELFELDPDVRDELLAELRSSPRFGPRRVAELSAFVSEYVGQQLRSSDPFVRDFAEAQHWAARAATDPAGAAAELARAYAELQGTERDRLLRLEAIVAAIAQPERASELESLLPYARALADWARGDTARAAAVLRSMANPTGQIQLGGLVLPLPPAMTSPPRGSAAQAISGEVTQQVDFSEVVQANVGEVAQAPDQPPPPADAEGPDREAMRDLRDALDSMLEEPPLALGGSAFARQLLPTQPDPVERGRQMQAALRAAIAALRPQQGQPRLDDPRWHPYLIISGEYATTEDARILQSTLGLSSAAYKRTRRAALERLLELLPAALIEVSSPQPPPVGPSQPEQLGQLRQQREAVLRRLRALEVQRAYRGINTSPEIAIEIEDLKATITRLDAEIQSLDPGGATSDVAGAPADEIAHLQQLYVTTTRRLHVLEAQAARMGPSASPSIVNEIESLRQELETTAQRLRELGAAPAAEAAPQPDSAPVEAAIQDQEERSALEALHHEVSRRLKFRQEQAAHYGMVAPPEILMEIEDLGAQLAGLERQLGGVPPLEQPAPAAETNAAPSAEEREKQLADEAQALVASCAQALGQLDAQNVPGFILEKALEISKANAGIVYLYDPQNQELVLAAERGARSEQRGRHLNVNEGIVGQAARVRLPLNVADVTTPRWSSIHIPVIAGTRSELAVPLLDGDQLRGVINLESSEVGHFDERAERLIQVLAGLGARALRGAQRIELERQRIDIQRRIAALEQQSHLRPALTPQSVLEIDDLRRQLTDLDRRLGEVPAEGEPAQTGQDLPPAQPQQDVPAEAITLHIARQGQGYSVSLVGAGSILRARLALDEKQLGELAGRARQALNEVVYTQMDGQYAYQQEQTIIAPVVHAQALQTLARVGFLLYEQLFYGPGSGEDVRTLGDRLRELSQRARLRITIVAERFFLPWALLYDRATIEPGNIEIEGFWGLRHVIECQVPSAAPPALGDEAQPEQDAPAIAPRDRLLLAFVGDTNIDRRLQTPIVENHRSGLEMLPNVRLADFSTLTDLYALLGTSTPAELIYFFGHLLSSGPDRPGDEAVALGLPDGQVSLGELRARAPSSPLPGRPLVFLNADRSRDIEPARSDGFAPYFLSRGARVVIGSEASLPALFAAEFGQEFVARFAAGEQTAGNLLLSLRRAYAEQRLNLLGLCYTLYGHADTRVVWPAPTAPAAPEPPRKAPQRASKRSAASKAAAEPEPPPRDLGRLP